ncbi:porin [Lichenihabitans sp. PAMC28606]|uniref:porin n=1 Tax=Lichenihabitans sp. PAMC28606 TaxID=2880932 RepID=UPI001D0A6CB5|nr:porin [Lichenihabitans sp. PAMC28606]UDL95129.1 porin [Lichenihabitans sp. PAMC28606]
MKLVKSLLLGSVAGMAAIAGAQAADLPFRKAAPVEYVRVCDWTGAGYFYIPGTDTCLKVGGIIRAEYAYIQNNSAFFPTPGVSTVAAPRATGTFIPGRSRDASGFFARGRIDADARTQTAYGTLRTYVRFQIDRLQGNYSGGGVAGGQNSFANQGGNNAYLDKGFIQFAGFTAGRVQSFFDFYADNYNFEGIANSDESNNVFAYTATFGGGFSATISVEDRNGRNLGQNIGNIAFGNGAINPAAGLNGLAGANAVYAGETIPDVVGVLRVDQAWGAAQISAAYHDVNTVAGPLGNVAIANQFANSTTEGFAVQGGVQIKLPMLAAGDDLWIEGGYQEGAYLYQDSSNYLNAGFNSLALGGFQHIDRDAVAIGNGTGGYTLQKGSGFHVMGALHHYFTPQFHDVLFGSYETIGYGNIVKNIDWTRGGIGDASEFRVGNQFIFTPVHDLNFGVEVIYMRIDQTLAHELGQAATALPVGVKKNPDAFEARLRVERDF